MSQGDDTGAGRRPRAGHVPSARAAGSRRRSSSRVDVVDDTFIRAAPERIRATLDEDWLRGVWPHLRLQEGRDRGVKGLRWTVTGQVVGELEVWIEPYWDGAVVHHYVRGIRGAHAPRDVATRHTLRWKRAVHRLKDLLEGGGL